MTQKTRRLAAVAYALAQVKVLNPPDGFGADWFDDCQGFVRTALQCPGGARTAREQWQSVPSRYRHPDPHPPAGVPMFWSPNHTALSMGAGLCASTDIKRHGQIDVVPMELIAQRWGLRYLGWTQLENGVWIYGGPA